MSLEHDESLDDNQRAALHERFQRCQLQTAGTELDLSNLQLTELPLGVVTMFPTLRRLNLRKNLLCSLPQDFAKLLPQLVILNVADNALTHLPESFGSLRHLQKLSLANNQLQELPSSFSRLHAVDDLNLAGNQLQTMDEDIGNQLIKLKTLILAKNPLLREIPASFGSGLTMLRVVDLSGNDQITFVPEKIRRLHERNVILHSRAKRRELISRALRVREAVSQTILNANIVSPKKKIEAMKSLVKSVDQSGHGTVCERPLMEKRLRLKVDGHKTLGPWGINLKHDPRSKFFPP